MALLFVVPVIAILCWSAAMQIRAHRFVNRENARRRRQYDWDCVEARRLNLRPPFPPNRLIVG